MFRQRIAPRPDWQDRCEALGFDFHTAQGVPYWDESTCYRFSLPQIEQIEQATAHLQECFIEATEYAFAHDLHERLRLPRFLFEYARRSWQADEPSLYGRFDLHFDGQNPPKLFEYNADTPTGLAEAAIVQWFWLQDVFPGQDQFNSIHEKLVSAFEYFHQMSPVHREPFHFACLRDSPEDLYTIRYLMDVAMQAGWSVRQLFVCEIGYDCERLQFVDLQEEPISTLFKLYGWEWLATDDFGHHLPEVPMCWVEPAWKALWSNKAMLVLLHELFPNDPHVLPASQTPAAFAGGTVKKPIFSREGANIEIRAPEVSWCTAGTYGAEGYIWQQFVPLPELEGHRPVIGSWVVGGEPAGIGIRETDGLVTDNLSRFVPHYIASDS